MPSFFQYLLLNLSPTTVTDDCPFVAKHCQKANRTSFLRFVCQPTFPLKNIHLSVIVQTFDFGKNFMYSELKVRILKILPNKRYDLIDFFYYPIACVPVLLAMEIEIITKRTERLHFIKLLMQYFRSQPAGTHSTT